MNTHVSLASLVGTRGSKLSASQKCNCSRPASPSRTVHQMNETSHIHTNRLHTHIHTRAYIQRETHTKRTWMYTSFRLITPPSHVGSCHLMNRPRERRPSHPRWRNRRRRIPAPGTMVISQLLRKIVTCNYDNTATGGGCFLLSSQLFSSFAFYRVRGGSARTFRLFLIPRDSSLMMTGTDRGGVYRRERCASQNSMCILGSDVEFGEFSGRRFAGPISLPGTPCPLSHFIVCIISYTWKPD